MTDSNARPEHEDEQPTHRLYLGKRWGEKAENNIEEWGNQRPDTVLLALIEEVGEIAEAMQENCKPGGGPPPVGDYDDRPDRGRELIRRMAALGLETRDYLEAEYPAPAGEGTVTDDDEIRIIGPPIDDRAIMDEIEDAAPLLWQLFWAIEKQEVGYNA